MKKIVAFRNSMQRGKYTLTSGPGRWPSSLRFDPAFTPSQMLQLGVFEGWYLNSARKEYPAAWFLKAKLTESGADPTINAFRVKSRQPLEVWRDNGWINEQDPRGWFEWYCRFYQGRRSEDDERQIKRWRAFVRHSAQVKKNGMGRVDVRPVQRQALLQWAHDPFPDVTRLKGESILRKTKRLLKSLSY